MPGHKEYLDVESAVKILGNLLPEDAGDTDADKWNQLKEMAEKLDQNVGALIGAATGSQKQKANDLKPIVEQLVRAIERVADGSADEGGIATTRSAITALPSFLDGFDEAKLKAKKSIFSWS